MPPKRKKPQNNNNTSSSSTFTPRTLHTEESFSDEKPENNNNTATTINPGSRRHSTASSVVTFGFASNGNTDLHHDHGKKNTNTNLMISSPDPKIPVVKSENTIHIPSLPQFSTVMRRRSEHNDDGVPSSSSAVRTTSQENSSKLLDEKNNSNGQNHQNKIVTSSASNFNSPSSKTRHRSREDRVASTSSMHHQEKSNSNSTSQNNNNNNNNNTNINHNSMSPSSNINYRHSSSTSYFGSHQQKSSSVFTTATKQNVTGGSASSSTFLHLNSGGISTNANISSNNNPSSSSSSFLHTRKRFGSQYQSIAPPLLDSFIQFPKALYNLWRFFFLAMITLLDRILDLFLLPIRPFTFQRVTARHLVLGAFSLVGALSLVLFSNGESPTHAYSAWYHFIQSISALKLYMMSNVLEMAEKLVANVGSDMFESLYADSGLGGELVIVSTPVSSHNSSSATTADSATTTNNNSSSSATHRSKFLTPDQVKKLRISEASSSSSSSSSSSASSSSSIPPVYEPSPIRTFLLIIGCVVVSSLHSLLLIMQCIVYNVALNGGASLIALLASSNFSELRKVAFKRTAPEELFRYSSADVIENVQLIFIFVVILLRHSQSLGAFGTVATRDMYWILLAEIFIDSCKHLIMMRNNTVKDSIYARFEATWFWDVARDIFKPKYLSDCLVALENPARVFSGTTSSSSSNINVNNTNHVVAGAASPSKQQQQQNSILASQTLPPRFSLPPATVQSQEAIPTSSASPTFTATQQQQQHFPASSFTTTVDETLLLGFPHRRCGLVPIPYVAVLWWICYPVVCSTSPVVLVWFLLLLCTFKLVLRAVNRGMAARWVMRAKSWGPKRPPLVVGTNININSNNNNNNENNNNSSSSASGIEELPKLEQDLLEKLDRMQQFKTEKEK